MARFVKFIDGMTMASERDFHSAIARELEFPDYYGKNLNALWDCLNRDVERPVSLFWKHSDAARAMLGHRFWEIVDLMRRVEKNDLLYAPSQRFELHLL